MIRHQLHDKWTSREGHTYNYTIVTINHRVVRVFNHHRHTISPNSEVYTHFNSKYDGIEQK